MIRTPGTVCLLAVVAVLNVPAYFSTSMVYAAEASAPETQKLAKSGDVASDPAVRALMKSAMGSDLHSYDDFSQLTAEPEVSGDDIIVTSGVRGLFTISETFLVVNPVKKTCFVGVMEDGKTMNLYGPATTVGQLPKLAQDFLAICKNALEQHRSWSLRNQEPSRQVCPKLLRRKFLHLSP